MQLALSVRHAGVVLVVLAAGACGGSDGEPAPPTPTTTGSCKLGDVGDSTQPIQIEVTALGVDQTTAPLGDGGDLPLVTPPQGGRVSFVGVRAKNLSPCAVTLRGTLTDPATGKSTSDARALNLKPTADGYAASSDSNIGTFANVPVCPNQWASGDAYDAPYELTVELTDQRGRKASRKLTVTPRCVEAGSLGTDCRTLCKPG